MKECKITVLRNDIIFQDLIGKYNPEELPGKPCEQMQPGEVYFSDGYQKPDGFCAAAWDAIGKLAAVLALGGKVYGRYYNIACCNDGLHPVQFLLEAVEK